MVGSRVYGCVELYSGPPSTAMALHAVRRRHGDLALADAPLAVIGREVHVVHAAVPGPGPLNNGAERGEV